QRPTSVSRPCVNYFTQLAQIRHAVVWTPSFGAGPQIGGPLSGQTRLRCPREPTSIQNDSGLLRPIHVCPLDLPIRSVAGSACGRPTARGRLLRVVQGASPT